VAGTARFKRRARLISKADFRNVFERPEKSGDSCFTVLARSNSLGFPRLGLAISRKSVQSAVVRNRIKRIVRESFRHHQQTLGSIDVVVIGRGNLIERDNAVLFDSLQRHWVRLVRQCTKSCS
jgi:ribonuclease P protein component